MDKRDFLKTGLVGALGLAAMPTFARNKNSIFQTVPEFQLPDLPYAYDALEPYIDKETMVLHHDKHHAAYTAKFNAAIKELGITSPTPKEILQNVSKYNEAILNNGGGFMNHRMFWKMMTPNGGGAPTGEVAAALNTHFGSFENFKDKMGTAAKTAFGSGWAWLIAQNNELKITTTSNQYSPLMDVLPEAERGFPLLCIDVWEHAYYLKYQNRRTEYVDAFWNVVNWETVSKRFSKTNAE